MPERTDGSYIPQSEAVVEWAAAARPVLIETARTYNAFLTYQQLADEVQLRSGITTRSAMRNWIGSVLGRVVDDCHARREPNLSALVLRASKEVGPGYRYAIELYEPGEVPDDLDRHAAAVRLECYRFYEAPDLPADGGTPRLPPGVKPASSRTRRVAPVKRDTCPTCHLVLPASGRCDNCD